MTEAIYVQCSDVRAVGFDDPCCTSCHDDWLEGYSTCGPSEDEYEFEVCCAVANWLTAERITVAVAHARSKEPVHD